MRTTDEFDVGRCPACQGVDQPGGASHLIGCPNYPAAANAHESAHGERNAAKLPEWEREAREFERRGNAAMANGLVIRARRYFRIADEVRRGR